MLRTTLLTVVLLTSSASWAFAVPEWAQPPQPSETQESTDTKTETKTRDKTVTKTKKDGTVVVKTKKVVKTKTTSK